MSTDTPTPSVQPQTPLGEKLAAARREVLGSGRPLLSADEIRAGVQPAGDAAPPSPVVAAARAVIAAWPGIYFDLGKRIEALEFALSEAAYAEMIAKRGAGDAVPMVDPAPVAWMATRLLRYGKPERARALFLRKEDARGWSEGVGPDADPQVTPLYAAPAGDVPRQDLGDPTEATVPAVQRPAGSDA